MALNIQAVDDKKVTRSKRGAEARAKIKRAAACVLEDMGYHKMRIADVTKEAGIAAGLFYHYFPDLKTLTIEVLGDFIAQSQDQSAIEKDVAKGDWFGRMLAYYQVVVEGYARHPGLTRCLLQVADEDKAFAELLRQNWVEQLRWLVKVMPKLFPNAELDDHQSLMLIYALGGNADLILRHYFIDGDTALTAKQLNTEEVAELLAFVFYRGLFLQNPPLEQLNYTRNLLPMVKQTDAANT